jgi:hypothetical protein
MMGTTAYMRGGRSADNEKMAKKMTFPSFPLRKISIRRFGGMNVRWEAM